MNPAIQRMLERYPRNTLDKNVNALREILQQLALLGLWRSKFFERAAFYGGSALRILYGLERYSEDLDFSLLTADRTFSLNRYGSALKQELAGFGFEVSFEPRQQVRRTAVESAFIKTNTLEQMIVIEADRQLLGGIHPSQKLKIRLEVDVDPPDGFSTEFVPVLQPIPFGVRVYKLPDLFAGKMHALLCRKWRNRVKGRDWYDFVWYIANYPRLHLSHLERRMRQSGDYVHDEDLTPKKFKQILRDTVHGLNIDNARSEVEPFVPDPGTLSVWSTQYFNTLIDRIQLI